jgi:SAM-dependent methyltransferase
MPFREGSFDKVVCIGVIQHTPDPEKSFLALPRYLKPGGRLAVDVYRRNDGFRGWIDSFLDTKHFVRSFTRRMSAETLYRCVEGYINLMWPIATAINKIPKVGRSINWRLMVADFRGVFPLSDPMLKEWAILDTFDMLSPKFDFPQTIDTVQAWFANAGLTDIEVHAGFNGIEGRGRKPA